MWKRFLAIHFLMLVVIASSGQDITRQQADSLVKALNKSKVDSTRISLLIKLTDYYLDRGSLLNQPDTAAFFLQQARLLNEEFHIVSFKNQINILAAKHYCAQHSDAEIKTVFMPVIDTCKKTGDILNEGEAWVQLADRLGNDSEVASFKITCYQNAMVLAQHRLDKNDEMAIRRYIADVHLQQRKFDLAERELFQILKEGKNIKPLYVMCTYDLLTAVYLAKGTYDKALSYALQTVKLMEANGDFTYANTFYNRLSIIYQYLGKPSESIKWQTKYLEHSLRINDPARIFGTIVAITQLLLRQGNPQKGLDFVRDKTAKNKPTTINDRRIIEKVVGDCYNALGKYDLAEKHFLEVIRLGKEQNNKYPLYERGADNSSIGVLYFKRGNYDKARLFLETALKIYEEWGQLQPLKNTHLSLFKVDSALGNYVEAIKNLQQSNLIGDSIFSIARNKQIEQLQIAYQTEQKDKDFRLLQGKEKLAQVQLQHTESSRNWMIAGASMLLVIVGLLYRQALMRKKNNKAITRKSDQLQHLLSEKEWLLKEIHHRVKNNLQIVMSLLNSQSAYIDNEPALTAIHDSQHRVHAMSLIHQKLYNAENVSTINISSYVRELCSYLSESFDAGQRARFQFDVAPVELDVSQAVPLGLILNEAITNSIKYAFPDGRNGVISISLTNTSPRHYVLFISDDGVGVPSDLTRKKPGSLGMTLMEGLSEDLDGDFSIENNNGTTIRISFVQHLTVRQPETLTASFV